MTARLVREPTADDVDTAVAVVSGHLPPTPVVASPGLGRDVVLKLETLLPTGSFKVRGALAAVAAARAEDPHAVVVTASAGNHGLGVAFAAVTLGSDAIIVIPTNASEAKRRALEDFDVDVVRHGASYQEAETRALALAATPGRRFVSAYNDAHVIAGQASIARELTRQVPGLTTIVAPVGGGGLLSGLIVACEIDGVGGAAGIDGGGGRRSVAVHGVETAASRAVSTAVAAGGVVPVPVGDTMADGLAGNIEAGSVTVGLIARGVESLAAVDEATIADAVRYLAFVHGIVAEPSGAVAVAGLLSGQVRTGPGPTAVVVTGRNVTPDLLGALLFDRR